MATAKARGTPSGRKRPGQTRQQTAWSRPPVSRQALALVEHDLVRKPVPTPDRVRGTLFRDHALMRIVGGRLRGRALAAPKSAAIRPTADRLRESLFNILIHAYGDPVSGVRVLDLFAGTGALGLEAMSRGAAFALFVDDGVEAPALLRQNVETLGAAGVTPLFRR